MWYLPLFFDDININLHLCNSNQHFSLLLNHQTTLVRRVAPIPCADAVGTLMHIQGGPHTMPRAVPVI